MSSPQKISPPQKPFALPSAKIPFATASKSPSYPEDTKPDDTSPYLKSNEQGLQLVDHSNEGYLGEVTNVWDNALTIPPAQSVQFSNSKILRLVDYQVLYLKFVLALEPKSKGSSFGNRSSIVQLGA